MNGYFFFTRTMVVCGLIVAANTNTARSQFYDPLGVQNKYKPFGQYGPTFEYTSPTKVMNVLNGRSNNQPSRRAISPRQVRLDHLNLLVSKPSGPWQEVNSKEIGSAARYMISRHDPTIVISLAGEQSEMATAHTDNAALLAESKAKIENLGGIIEQGEQQLSAGGIKGIAYSASISDGDYTTYYAMWVASHQGYNYKLAVYGDKRNKTMIDEAMRNFVNGIQSSQPNSVAHRNSQKTTTRR